MAGMAGRPPADAGGPAPAKMLLSLVKNPFQKHKEEAEERRRRNAEEAARELAAFTEEMGSEPMVAPKAASGAASDRPRSSRDDEANKASEAAPLRTSLRHFARPSGNSAAGSAARKRRQMDELLEELKRDQAERGTKRTRDDALPDESTTNIYVGYLSTQASEDFLCHEFGRFGAIGSIKIMWPRVDEHAPEAPTRMSAFVSFMTREAAEAAFRGLDGKRLLGSEVRLSWGKPAPLPATPLYDPTAAPAGGAPLPFGARPVARRVAGAQSVYDSEVVVAIPEDMEALRLIHRTVEFVLAHGFAFEVALTHREHSNPAYAFLRESSNPLHVYYRWRLYASLQGDSATKWSTEPFRMFEGGARWIPPPLPDPPEAPPARGVLAPHDRDHLEKLLATISMEEAAIGDAMVWVIEHADGADEVADVFVRALTTPETPVHLILARLFLVSDILHNSSARVQNAWKLRAAFEMRLEAVFKHLHDVHRAIPARLRAEQLRKNVHIVLNVWTRWMLYPPLTTQRWLASFVNGDAADGNANSAS